MEHVRVIVAALAVVGAGPIAGLPCVHASPSGDGPAGEPIGPDLIIGALSNTSKYGTVNGISAYAIGATSCNVGDEIVLWCDTDVAGLCVDTDHPVRAQNMYRLKGGRIEQIGMSWVMHGFCASSQSICGTCIPDPFGCNALGVGCAEANDSSLSGSQGNLGPRSQVNASTGEFPYPFAPQPPPAPPTIGRRIQVAIADLDPAQNVGALYFGECQDVSPQEAQAGNGGDNASYRRLMIGPLTNGAYAVVLAGATFQRKPAIEAWRDHGLGLDVPDPDVSIVAVDIPEDGRFVVASKASPVDDDTWHYEYAVFNTNSDRSGGSLFVPIAPSVDIDDAAIGQHIINHHSGEPYSTAPWTQGVVDGGVRWSTDAWSEADPNANALRWGTMFNFRFDADAPPVNGEATLGLYKPGTPASVQVAVVVPAGGPIPGDLDGDGDVDGADLGILLGAWGSRGPLGDLNGDDVVDGGDLGVLLVNWT